GERGGSDLLPGSRGIGVSVVLVVPQLKLRPLGGSKGHGIAFSGDAVPDLFDQREPLLDIHLVDSECFESRAHLAAPRIVTAQSIRPEGTGQAGREGRSRVAPPRHPGRVVGPGPRTARAALRRYLTGGRERSGRIVVLKCSTRRVMAKARAKRAPP